MALILFAALAAAQPAYDSVYTELDLDACALIDRAEEGDYARWRCEGHATIPLFVNNDDGRFDIDAGIENGKWESRPWFNEPGPRVEWRIRGREAVAVIFRLLSASPERPGYSELLIATIGRAGRPGCLVARIDGRRSDANEAARAVADTRAATFRCETDQAEGPPD
jgi:hypothetical protein